jgi:hypothetical protein
VSGTVSSSATVGRRRRSSRCGLRATVRTYAPAVAWLMRPRATVPFAASLLRTDVIAHENADPTSVAITSMPTSTIL